VIRALCILVGVVLLAGCGGGGNTTRDAATSLTITVWPQGEGKDSSQVFHVSCDPLTGDLADPAAACAQLAEAGTVALAPVPLDAMCTQIYGGPAEARIVGTLDGVDVDARLSRVNGCEVARWEALSALLPSLAPA